MNKLNTTLAFAAGIAVLAGVSAQAQTLIYNDSFAVPNGNLDSASLSRLSGVDGSLVAPQSGGVEQTITGGQLNLLGSGNGSVEMRFGVAGSPNSGNTPNLYDWSSGTGGADIAAAGGFTVSFNWTAGDTSSGNWLFFAVGTLGDRTGGNLRVLQSGANATTAGILLKNSGSSQVFNAGTHEVADDGTFPVTSVNHVVDITYDFSSWANGSPVTMTATVDGNAAGSDSFTWANAGTGEFFDIGSYDENNTIGDLNIDTLATVPEPSSWVMLAGGLGTLVAFRRFRRS